MSEPRSYKTTLNLPKTAFPMKANLVQNEPASLKRWEQLGLYAKLRERAAEAKAAGKPLPPFVFHDGPPYANGDIHLGHLLNKSLKDFVVRSRTMLGHDCPYTPGWDCHGLPIEHKVMQEMAPGKGIEGSRGRGAKEEGDASDSVAAPSAPGPLDPSVPSPLAIRKKCAAYAGKFVKTQTRQMQRLLTLADYDDPYLTMSPRYEAGVLHVFADMVEKGLVYRDLKPVHWSIDNQTALAEAELEYHDKVDTSVYVKFEVAEVSRDSLYDAFSISEADPLRERSPALLIWTTTPWTLPANLAVAINPEYRYSLVEIGDDLLIIAEQLVESVHNKCLSVGRASRLPSGRRPENDGVQGSALTAGETPAPPSQSTFRPIGTTDGFEIIGLKYNHPFRESKSDPTFTVMSARFVTMEDGSGLVHIAPGHGNEDYQLGITENLPVYCPVQADGTYDDTVPDWLRGLDIWKANPLVVEHLRASGHLFFDEQFTHSYPHDWRGKKPVIFRATEQWFVGVDKPFNLESDPQGLQAMGLRSRATTCIGFDYSAPVTLRQQEIIDEQHEQDRQAWIEALEDEKNGIDPMSRRCSPEDLEALQRKFGPYMQLLNRKEIKFIPDWGRNRMRGMLESRPDWCISRQRSWGLPIPAFFNNNNEPLLTAASVRAVAKMFSEKGSDAWFYLTTQDLLKHYDPANDPDAPAWARDFWPLGTGRLSDQSGGQHPPDLSKGLDTFDVWFESGSSWNAVLRAPGGWRDKQARECFSDTSGGGGGSGGGSGGADLYLEGSDQHRGWFQHSLLPALAVTGQSPFKTVLTHGFMVDRDGKKMSKSGGNALNVDDLFKEYGADVCRWWVAGLNPDNDIKVDASFFKLAGEEYRKVRNTLRFLLSNLNDFKPSDFPRRDPEIDTEPNINGWVLSETYALRLSVLEHYKMFEFRHATRKLYDFCNDTLSAIYLAAVKDRMYCDSAESYRRRQAQAAMHKIAEDLCLLLAPILPHTADETWRTLWGESECVHLQTACRTSHGDYGRIAIPTNLRNPPVNQANWSLVMIARDFALKRLETARATLNISNPLDLGYTISTTDADKALLAIPKVDIADLLGISLVTERQDGKSKVLDLTAEPRCERSWKRDGTVKQRSDGGMLSDRDALALGLV